jgi:hypothetical protein
MIDVEKIEYERLKSKYDGADFKPIVIEYDKSVMANIVRGLYVSIEDGTFADKGGRITGDVRRPEISIDGTANLSMVFFRHSGGWGCSTSPFYHNIDVGNQELENLLDLSLKKLITDCLKYADETLNNIADGNRMSKFIAYIKQRRHSGCEYTIGCGKTVFALESTTHNEAVEELRREIIGTQLTVGDVPWRDERCGYWKNTIESATIYEIVNRYEMPVAEWYGAAEERRREIAEKE